MRVAGALACKVLQLVCMNASPTVHHDTATYPPAYGPAASPQQHAPRLYPLGSVRENVTKNTIRFKCGDCARQIEARVQDGGVDTNCPHCNAPITVPRIPANPYLRSIKMVVHQMKAVPLPFPYIPQLIQLVVMTLVLGIFAVLFVSIGLVSQIAGVFKGLIFDTRKHLREGSAIERSAQAISIAIYSLLWLPFWLIQLPFSFLGSLWSSSRIVALGCVAGLLAIVAALEEYLPQLVRLLHSI